MGIWLPKPRAGGQWLSKYLSKEEKSVGLYGQSNQLTDQPTYKHNAFTRCERNEENKDGSIIVILVSTEQKVEGEEDQEEEESARLSSFFFCPLKMQNQT